MILIKRRSSSAADVDQFGSMQVTRLYCRQKNFDEPSIHPFSVPLLSDLHPKNEAKNQTESHHQRIKHGEFLPRNGSDRAEEALSRPPISYRKTRAVSLISNQDQNIANIVSKLSEKGEEDKVFGIVTKIRSLKSRKAKIKSFQAHRSKSLTQIDCIEPPSHRLGDGHGLSQSRGPCSSNKSDSSPEAGITGSCLAASSDLHYSADRLVVPTLHHASSLGLDDDERRFKSHLSSINHQNLAVRHKDMMRKNFIDDSGNNSMSQDGTLKTFKNRGQLARRTGGIFSNPFRTDREKMDQLTELLNQYSQHGIPDVACSLVGSHPAQKQHHSCSNSARLSDYGGSSESDKSDSDSDSLFLEEHWRVLVQDSENLPKKLQNQQDAIWELLHTEVFYIKRLKVISDLFLTCLCNLQSECLLNDIDTDKMFSNITEVYSANHYFWINHLLPMLKASRENHQPLNPIIMKEGFLKFEDIFHPYVKYCLEHSNCLQYVKEKHKESELFKAYVVWCETRKDCDRLRLMDLLVKPMQRLTKYSLLLKAILKKTEAEDQRIALEQMNESVERFVSRVDACLRHHSDRVKLDSIVSRIESYDALDSSNDEVEKVLKEFCRLDLTCPMPGCLSYRIRQLILEGSGLKLRDSATSSKVDVHCFLFTDVLLICKPVGRKGDKVRVIRQPFCVDRIVTHELRDSSGFIVIYLNEFHVASAFFSLYTSETRTWLESIRQAQEQFREAKHQSVLLSAQSSFIYRTVDGDEDDPEILTTTNVGAMFQGTSCGNGLMVTNSRSTSLIYSASDSVDTSDAISSSQLGSQMIAPSTTPNFLSSHYGADASEMMPSRAISFELGELRNPSMTLDDIDTFGRSHSMETRTPSVTITSPRPERRAFLLRGAGGGGGGGSSHDSINSGTSVNTLSVNVPSLHINKRHHHVHSSASSSPLSSSSRHQHHETCIQVPTIISQNKPPHAQSSSPSSMHKTSPTSRHRSVSPRSLQRSLPVIQPANKPPLIKMKNISGLRVHSAPPSEDPSPVHSFDSEQGSCESATLGGSDGHIEMSKVSHHHHYYPSTQQSLRHFLPQSSTSHPQQQQQINPVSDEDVNQVKSRLHQKRSVRGERRYHTADSIENMKKEKDTSIHKRLSWNYGQQQGTGRSSGSGHERLLCNKHFSKCLSSESVYTSSGFSSTGSVPLSVNSCECEQCGAEVLSHIQEIETTESCGDLGQEHRERESEKPHSSPSLEEDYLERPDIKIDVSEVKDGISSVQITVSGTNIAAASKSDLKKKMKDFLLTSLEASEV